MLLVGTIVEVVFLMQLEEIFVIDALFIELIHTHVMILYVCGHDVGYVGNANLSGRLEYK